MWKPATTNMQLLTLHFTLYRKAVGEGSLEKFMTVKYTKSLGNNFLFNRVKQHCCLWNISSDCFNFSPWTYCSCFEIPPKGSLIVVLLLPPFSMCLGPVLHPVSRHHLKQIAISHFVSCCWCESTITFGSFFLVIYVWRFGALFF